MPPMPILGESFREIRAFEILRHFYAHYLGNAAADINSAREIGIELSGVQYDRKKNVCTGKCFTVGSHELDDLNCPVGYQKLLKNTPKNQKSAAFEAVIAEPFRLIELMSKVGINSDRTLNNLRKKRDEKSKLSEIFFGIDLTPVNVNHIAHALKCIERNSERNDKIKTRLCVAYPEHFEQGVNRIGAKAEIF